uniref:Uncharacterized protein n=1 Tax=Zooxanthella nutricula TaxID=1333877 RepID=A0A7S2PVF0_9DINO
MAASSRGQKRRRATGLHEGERVLGPLESKLARALAEDVTSGMMNAATAHILLKAMNQDMTAFGYRAENTAECETFLRQCLTRGGRALPELSLVVDDSNWGKTGSRSSREDYFAIYRIGTRQVHIGILVQDHWDQDTDDESDCGECKPVVESFSIIVKEISEAAMQEFSAQSVFSHSYDGELLSIFLAAPSGGAVHTSTIHREKCDRVFAQAGCRMSFEQVVATALHQMARKHRFFKPMAKAFATKRGVPQDAKPLFQAFQAHAQPGPDASSEEH